jgi:hypothetical protein
MVVFEKLKDLINDYELSDEDYRENGGLRCSGVTEVECLQ